MSSNYEALSSDDVKSWPQINVEAAEEDSAKLIYEVTKEALQVQVAGGRKLVDRCSSLLPQAVTLSLASIGAVAFLIKTTCSSGLPAYNSPMFNGLLVSSLILSVSSAFCALGMRSLELSEIGCKPRNIYDDTSFQSKPTDVYIYLTRVLGDAIAENEKKVNAMANRLDRAVSLLVLAPIVGTMVCFLTVFLK